MTQSLQQMPSRDDNNDIVFNLKKHLRKLGFTRGAESVWSRSEKPCYIIDGKRQQNIWRVTHKY